MVRLDVPLVLQPRDFEGCGENTIEMVYKALAGEDEDVDWEKVDPNNICHQKADDAHNDDFARVAQELFECTVRINATIQDILNALHAGHPVMVNYLMPYHTDPDSKNPFAHQFHPTDEFPIPPGSHEYLDGHYSVVIGYEVHGGETVFILNDPLRGEITITAHQFDAVWRAYYSSHVRWMVVAHGIHSRFRVR